MDKVDVTKQLAETIKEIRIQYKVPAKEVADALNKSNAYITKLERGDIQTISWDDLITIIDTIAKKANDPSTVEERIAKLVHIKLTDEEIKDELWLYNFDMVIRMIPISKELIDYINEFIKTHNIGKTQLFDRINSNEGLTDEDRQNNDIPLNVWYLNSFSQLSIKLKLNWITFNNILEYKTNKASYIYIYSILTYIYRIAEDISTNEKSFSWCQNRAVETMNNFKFFSLLEKNALSNREEVKTENDNLLTSFDIENTKTINTILDGFRFMSEADIIIANERLKEFSENMKSDLGFMSKIISLNYIKLNNLSYNKKRQFLSDIENLIDKYSEDKNNNDSLEFF